MVAIFKLSTYYPSIYFKFISIFLFRQVTPYTFLGRVTKKNTASISFWKYFKKFFTYLLLGFLYKVSANISTNNLLFGEIILVIHSPFLYSVLVMNYYNTSDKLSLMIELYSINKILLTKEFMHIYCWE